MIPLIERDFTEQDDPWALAEAWLEEAKRSEPNDPEAMALATADARGLPDVRMVLLKGLDARGFVFYTNAESAKGQELAANAQAALVLHWKSLRRQIRARGAISEVAADEADRYFATRHPRSQAGAWASAQSRPLASRAELEARVAAVEERFKGGAVPRPPHWKGYRITPQSIEFWQDGAARLHDRVVFTPTGSGGWDRVRLNP